MSFFVKKIKKYLVMSKKSSTFVVDFANKRLRCPATRVVFGKSPLRLKCHFNRVI